MAVTITVDFSPQVGTNNITIEAVDATWTKLISLERTDPWGRRFTVRGSVNAPLTGGVITLADAEGPLDADVTYVALITDAAGNYDQGSAVAHTPTDVPWRTLLAVAYNPFNVIMPNMEEMPEVSRSTQVGVYDVLNRPYPVVVTGHVGARSGSFSLLTTDQDHTDNIWHFLARGDLMLLRTTRGYGLGVLYFIATDITEQRITRLGMFQQRRFNVEFVETDPPGAGIIGPSTGLPGPNTWQLVADEQDTWGGVLSTRKSWQELLDIPYGQPVSAWDVA